MRIVIRLGPTGEFDAVLTDAPAEVYIVADHCPNDRVYRLTVCHEVGVQLVTAALGDDPIGVADDGVLDVGLEPRGKLAPRPRPALSVVRDNKDD